MKPACLLIALLLSGCASTVATDALLGPWFTNGPSFDLVIHEKTILFEFDMKEHPYRVEGDVLIIEFDDGPQRKRVLRLTADEMEWRDEKFGTISLFYRKGVWERSQ